MGLESITPQFLSGQEAIHRDNSPSGHTVFDFWRWTASDILSNATRGIFAEYLVAQALNLTGKPRDEWGTYDLETQNGIKIEVKSSGYLQAWFQRKHTEITFVVRKTKAYDFHNSSYGESKRHVDVYVFAVLKHRDKATVDPLNLQQWEFYVLPTLEIEKRNQQSISLKAIQKIASPVPFEGIRDAVTTAFQGQG